MNQPDPIAVDMQQFHGNLRLTLFSKIQALPPSINATPLLVAAGAIGELVALISNGDQKLVNDCITELRKAADRITGMAAEGQRDRLVALSQQIQVLTKRHKRERTLLVAGKDALGKLPPRR